jgi:hypothetical protein
MKCGMKLCHWQKAQNSICVLLRAVQFVILVNTLTVGCL